MARPPTAPAGQHAHEPWPARRVAWIAVGLLAVAAMVSQLDRIVVTLLVEPIKAEFHLSDASFGALQGIAFGICYTLANLVAGRLADRYLRKAVIGGGIALFSLFSIATGLARSYGQLFATRAGVGVGEASLYPAGFSIISDYFPRERLGVALAVFMMSSMVGIGFAYVAGGAMVGWIAHSSIGAALGGLSPWRATIVLIGLPGLVLAPFLFLIPEPKRRGGGGSAATLREVAAGIWTRRAPFGLICASLSVVTLVHYSMLAWAPSLFIRVYHVAAAEAGLRLGILFLVFATTGTVVAGVLSDQLGRRGVVAAPLKVAAGAFVAVGLFGALAPLMPTADAATWLYAPYVFLVVMPYPCAAAALQMLMPNRYRSQASGVYLTVINLIGFGVGPVMVGAFTDRLFTQPSDVRYSLAIVAGVGGPLMSLLMVMAARAYRAHAD